MAPCDEFDGIGDYLAADERSLHPFGTCGNSIIDRDRVDLDRRPAGSSHAIRCVGGEFPVIPVAGHCADPVVRYPDLRPCQAFVCEPHRPDELATFRDLLNRMETGELTLHRGTQDVSKHEISVLKQEIARLEKVLKGIKLEGDKPINYSGRTKRFSS